jgi:hypothetical protein
MPGWSLEYSFEIDIEKAIIYEKIHGIWKLDTAIKYDEDFRKEVQPLIAKPWAKLVNLTGWRTSYPQVIARIGEHLNWCRKHNLALSVNVLNNPSTFRQLNEMFSVGHTKEISQVFRTQADARKYLEENWFPKVK